MSQMATMPLSPASEKVPSSLPERSATTRKSGSALDLHVYLDHSLLQVIEHFFNIPGQQGITLFFRVLGYTFTPAEETPEAPRNSVSNYAAFISVECLLVLSRLIQYSYEITIMYVTLFITCGFIEKQKIKGNHCVYLEACETAKGVDL